ncbi:hypothetical protein JX266_002021 [Neoarthrinium moseri]|nr:hypothetical protein JX266_002021 [Neoarthrinium moseri]
MSTATAAPWRSLFLEHVEGMKSPEFTLSTIRRVPASRYGMDAGSGDGQGFVQVPRARTCIFRGMWANLAVNPKNDAELNPDCYESELLTFTTDVRMDKMPELWEGQPSGGVEGSSGGGGPVEAVFWADAPMVQWRVRGRAYVLAPDVESSEGGRAARDVLQARMRRTGAEGEGDAKGGWSWARELTAHFGNLSPGMRGSFRNPPPGTPVAVPVGDDSLALGQKVTDLQDAVARRHFRVVVIVPFEVDRCDLSDPERGRRWLYRFAGGEGNEKPVYPGGQVVDGWEKVETWP